MKTIGLVTYTKNSQVAIFLKNNLLSIFAGYAEIHLYSMDQLATPDVITDDIILVMIDKQVLQLKEYVVDTKQIVVVKRTTSASRIYDIFSIPAETKVLVVNDTAETTLETTMLLYRLGINHLNLIPYEVNAKYPNVEIAITPGEGKHVPKSMPVIIDIGQRYIDISTFIEIINKLEITDDEVSRRLMKYSDDIVSLDTGIKKQYKQLTTKNRELSSVINLSHEGILLINNEQKISLYNRSLETIFNITDNFLDQTWTRLFSPDIIQILSQDIVEDELMDYKGKSLIVNKSSVEYFGKTAGRYYIFREVTYIRKLEEALAKQIHTRGMLARYHFTDIIAQSDQMLKCIKFAKKAALSDLTVLIIGESGTGKELLAQSIHNASSRSKQPFVAFNCAAVPETLMESELFGYVGGTFTGALKEGKAGLFEQANHGTIFLDEIGDMPYTMQAKLLRVLQEQQVMRIGSNRITGIDVRIIAATNHDLRDKIKHGTFRADLYYRLNVLPMLVPSLRDRKDDILYLLRYFLQEHKSDEIFIQEAAIKCIVQYEWPGNIRELYNAAAYISFMGENTVELEHLPAYLLQHKQDFEELLGTLRQQDATLNCQFVLAALAKLSSLNVGAGRKSICEFLARSGISLTEGEIRRILIELNEEQLIHSGVGRHGSQISTKGKEFLGWLENRSELL